MQRDWQPIETAPKDGSQVLLSGGTVDTVYYDSYAVKPEMVVGWFRGLEYNTDIWVFCSFDGGLYGEYECATHWMPLPSPPK